MDKGPGGQQAGTGRSLLSQLLGQAAGQGRNATRKEACKGGEPGSPHLGEVLMLGPLVVLTDVIR